MVKSELPLYVIPPLPSIVAPLSVRVLVVASYETVPVIPVPVIADALALVTATPAIVISYEVGGEIRTLVEVGFEATRPVYVTVAVDGE